MENLDVNSSSFDTSSPDAPAVDLKISRRIPSAAADPIRAVLDGFGLRPYSLTHAGAHVPGVPRSIAKGIAASIETIAQLYPPDDTLWISVEYFRGNN